MPPPIPTPIYRIIHVDNLVVYLQRGGLHAPNHCPNDGMVYKTIHNIDIQNERQVRKIPCGPRGVIHDYVSFYFGHRSPMLLQLHSGNVPGYSDGQEPLVYLVSSAQRIASSNTGYVFSDGHGIAAYTDWYDDLKDLPKVDWSVVYLRMWNDTLSDMDRQRRKQAEFLVYKTCAWDEIDEIGVINTSMKTKVEDILRNFTKSLSRPVCVQRQWYY